MSHKHVTLALVTNYKFKIILYQYYTTQCIPDYGKPLNI